MKFKENKSIVKFLFQGWIGLSKTSFKVIGNSIIDNKKLIHAFINSPLDFPFGNKYVNGIEWNHTDKDGISKKSKVFNFGPYSLNKLSIDDYKEIPFNSLHQKVFDLISDFREENRLKEEYHHFLIEVEKLLKPLNKKDNFFFILDPSSEKEAEFHPYSLDSYLCIFSINRIKNILTVIQVDDS
jgi:hypothetical protein